MRLSLACSPGSVRAPPNNPNRIQSLRSATSLPLRSRGGEGITAALSLLCVGVGIDRLAGGVFLRPQDRLLLVGLPLLQVAALDVVELDLQHARFFPLAVGTEGNVADDRLDRVLAQPIGKLVLIEALRRLDRSLQYLHVGICERRQVIAERVDAFTPRLRLVFLQEVLDAGEV